MDGSEQMCTADELLARRELLREQGVFPTFEELCDGAIDAIREEVARRLADVLAAERAIEASWGGPAVASDRSFTPTGRAGRYAAPTVKAEGGMGVLCVAEDLELGRVVAYKVMKPGRDHDPVARARFFNEAEITARLAHPGIVPVFGRVTDDSGLPAYASEYVSGHTLAAAIERLHAIAPADASARAEARGALVRAFLSTCQIVAYAHSQDVVHGDIKPLNIMIDRFGATRLVDWGVARVVAPVSADGPAPASPGPRPGTPTFMSSPDTPATFASDIYALGLTLAWILAERPGDVGERLRPAIDAPPPLWAVAGKAMSGDHEARYRSAADLARDAQDVLEDRPIAAYRDRWPTRLRRLAARHRPAVATALALLLMVAIVGPLVGARERGLRRRADTERLRAVRLTGEMIVQAELVGQFQASRPGLRTILDRAVRLIDEVVLDDEAQGDDYQPAVANYYRAGLINLNLDQFAEAADCFRRATERAERRFAAAPADAENRNLWAASLRDWGVSRFMQGSAEDASRAMARALEVIEPVADASPEYRWTLARVRYAIGNLAMLSDDQRGAQDSFQQALDIASKLVEEAPADPRFVKALADVYSNQGMSFQAQALPDGRRLVAPDKLAAATASHRRALELRRRLTRLDPGKPEQLANVAASLNHLGNASLAAGEAEFAHAESFYQEARKILEALAVAYPGVPSNRREVAMVYSNLNVLFTRQNRPDEVLGLAKEAVELYTRLVADYPDTPDFHSELGISQEQLAANLQRRGETSGAADRTYDAAIAFARALNLTDEPNRRATLTGKTLALLHTLDAAGYFQARAHADALRDETAFLGLRDRSEFPKWRGENATPP